MKKRHYVETVNGQNALVCKWEDGTKSIIEFYKSFEIALAYATKLNNHYKEKGRLL